MRTKLSLIICIAVLASGIAVLKCGQAGGQQTVAYTDAFIETMGAGGRIKDGTLLVRSEKIVAVGKDIEIPADARVVSLSGKTILPGLVDPYFVFGRRPTPQPTPSRFGRGRRFRGGQQTRFSAGSFTKVGEYFYPYDTDFKPAIRTGITTANLVTDGRGLSALADMDSDAAEAMLFQPEGFLFAKVTNQTSAIDIIRNGLDPEAASRAQRGARSRFAGRRGGGRRGGRGGDPKQNNDTKETSEQDTADDDSTKSYWKEVRDGKKPLVVNVNNAATVPHVLKLMNKFDKVKLYLIGSGPNLYQSIDEVPRNVTLVMQPGIDQVPFTTRRMNVPQLAAEKQIPFVFSMSLNTSQMRASQDDPLFPVAALVKTGLPRETALRAITIVPAQMLGLDKTHGSLEKDKVANFLVFSGDPLATGSRLEQVVLKGRIVHEN